VYLETSLLWPLLEMLVEWVLLGDKHCPKANPLVES
jgi:hypothetical protein